MRASNVNIGLFRATQAHERAHTHIEGERRSVDSDAGSEREREHAQVAAAAAAANSCHSRTAHAFDRGCNARESHMQRESKNKSERLRLSVAWARESQGKEQEQKYLVLFLLPFLFGYFVGGKRSTYRLRFVAVATKQNSKANEALRKVFFLLLQFYNGLTQFMKYTCTFNSMYTNTHSHTDTRLHMESCTYIQYCMEVHRLCTLTQRETLK